MPQNHKPVSLAAAKKSAKLLKRQLTAGDAAAIARLMTVFQNRRDPGHATHADCLHVVAREAGADSWPRLKHAVETAAMNREQRIARLTRAIFAGNAYMIDRLCDLDPDLPDAHLNFQLAFARRPQALATLAANPAAATTPIDGRWPIHYLCFSKQRAPADQIALLDALLAAGADINQGMPHEPGDDHTLSPLYGALGHAGNLPLARAMLQRGADPNDNESLYHAAELSTLDGIRMLFEHGAEIGHTNAFYRMLDKEHIDGVRLFLENGADPNAPLYTHPGDARADQRNALHHAIIRGRSGDIGALLIEHGADPTARFDGRTPYALAAVTGNASMAAMLQTRDAATPLSDVEAFLAAIAANDAATARNLLAGQPGLRQVLSPADLARQTDLAMSATNQPILRLMLDLGFDPNHPGESAMPPIQAAAWWGHAAIVDMYIAHGVDLHHRNMFGGCALGTAIHGSSNCPGRDAGDYVHCVDALVAAGAVIDPSSGHLEMGSDEVTLLLEDHLAQREET